MASGLLADLALGPYCGKETGETALLLQLRDRRRVGGRFVLLHVLAGGGLRGVGVVMKNHHERVDYPADWLELAQ